MKKLIFLPETTFAGHCTVGGSNKVWAACLAREQEGVDGCITAPEASTEVVYLCVYGAYGARLRVELPQRLSFQQAKVLWQKKCREKTGKGYQPIAFASFLPSFVYPDGVALASPNQTAEAVAEDDTALGVLTLSDIPTPILDVPPMFRYAATPVKAALWEHVQEKMRDPHYGLSEKVNGVYVRYNQKRLFLTCIMYTPSSIPLFFLRETSWIIHKTVSVGIRRHASRGLQSQGPAREFTATGRVVPLPCRHPFCPGR